jgi:hypothetical protein
MPCDGARAPWVTVSTLLSMLVAFNKVPLRLEKIVRTKESQCGPWWTSRCADTRVKTAEAALKEPP